MQKDGQKEGAHHTDNGGGMPAHDDYSGPHLYSIQQPAAESPCFCEKQNQRVRDKNR